MAASIVAFNLLKLLLKSNNVVSIVTLCYFSSILRAEQDILESIHVLSLYENTHNSLYPRRDAMDTIRYDTIGEFNVDWKAEYSALSSTRSQKKKLKQPTPVPL